MNNPITTLRKRRQKRLRRERRAARKAAQRAKPMPFVVGVNRSGTTLLRMMLDSHPELAMPPETHFVPALAKRLQIAKAEGNRMKTEDVIEFLVEHRRWGDFGLNPDELAARIDQQKKINPKFVLRAFYGLYAEHQGKSRCGDKTPGYVKQMGLIQRALPEARFIHLIRDGRDVAVSRENRGAGEEHSVERHAMIWKRRINRARRQQSRLKHYLEVRYEALVQDPEAVLREVCDFIELKYDPAMLKYHERSDERLKEIARDLDDDNGGALRPAAERLEAHSLVKEKPRSDRVERWREVMAPEDVAEFEGIAADLLEELGYELSSPRQAEVVSEE